MLAFEHTIRRYERRIDKLRKQMKGHGVMNEFVAHKNGQLFHRATCKWAEKIPARSRVIFDSRVAAIMIGLKRCPACRS